jgi:RNA polymerase primary sigma factor
MRQLKISKQFTNRENKSLDKYLNEISKVPMIDAQEEVQLAQRIREGDQAALEKLVNANLRFVVSVSKQYQNQGLTLGDLINEGNMGLIKAAKRFDETRGFKFISYAVWWIRQSILQALADQSRIVRVPLNKVGVRNKVARASQEFVQQNEREPSIEELSEILSMDLEEVATTINLSNRHVSLDSPLSQDGETTMVDIMENSEAIPTDQQSHAESMTYEIELVLNSLPEKEQKVLRYLYGIGMDTPMGMEDIGTQFNLTRERVRQIRDKALSTLRQHATSMRLRSFL